MEAKPAPHVRASPLESRDSVKEVHTLQEVKSTELLHRASFIALRKQAKQTEVFSASAKKPWRTVSDCRTDGSRHDQA